MGIKIVYGLVGALAAASLLFLAERDPLRGRRRAAYSIYVEWIPGEGYYPFLTPCSTEQRWIAARNIHMFRARKRLMPADIDYQCGYCWKIYAGPDEGLEPGHEIGVGPSGAPVSHGACEPPCPENYFEREMRERYPDLERFRRGENE